MMRWHHYRARRRRSRPARRWTCASTSPTARAASATTAPTPWCSATARSSTPGSRPDTSLIPSFGYDERRRARPRTTTAGNSGCRRGRACTTSTTRCNATQSALTRDADFIAYRATVCTAADQLPVTSGYVERDWTENGRRCIAYRMDAPMAAIYPFVSARYATAQGRVERPGRRRRDRDRLPPRARVQPRPHGRRASRTRSRTSPRHFGPYQHKILRIVEFPRFSRRGGFAESFPNSRALQRGDRLHRARSTTATPRTSTTRTSSPRTRWRTSGGRTRRCRPTCRAPSSSPRASPSTRRSWC